jgi:hypothetical protein
VLLLTSGQKQALRSARTPLKPWSSSIIRFSLGLGALHGPKNRQESPQTHGEGVRFQALVFKRAIRPKDAHHIRTRAIKEAAGKLNNRRQSTPSAGPTPLDPLKATAIPHDSNFKRQRLGNFLSTAACRKRRHVGNNNGGISPSCRAPAMV